jgi:diguanylate cyclase (GGDEF)-like protein
MDPQLKALVSCKDSDVESTDHGVEKVSGNALETGIHTSANGSRPGSADEPSLMRGFNAFRREFAVAQAKLEELVADRASLLAKIEILEHGIQSVHRIAHHDELTGLPSRRLLEDRYDMAVARSERQRDNVALLFIDIDGFKNINDRYGHLAGDRVLQQVAVRLVACIRASDTACRYGGDEFVVLLSDNHGRADAVLTANKLRKQLSAPLQVDSQTLRLSVSIGIAMYPPDGPELSSMLRAADADMYRTKVKSDRTLAENAFTNEGAPPRPKQ